MCPFFLIGYTKLEVSRMKEKLLELLEDKEFKTRRIDELDREVQIPVMS